MFSIQLGKRKSGVWVLKFETKEGHSYQNGCYRGFNSSLWYKSSFWIFFDRRSDFISKYNFLWDGISWENIPILKLFREIMMLTDGYTLYPITI